MSNDLVVQSRAGDEFHYRWAARRSLGLIYPNAALRKIVIEGSAERTEIGEYVIDVTEYYEYPNNNKLEYYQLKHTSVRTKDPFTLSDLQDTIEGFAKRFIYHQSHLEELNGATFSFSIITNRPIASAFKRDIAKIVLGEPVGKRFKDTIEEYTGLKGKQLQLFCQSLQFEDGEGNYRIQKDQLRQEIAQLIAGAVENAQIDSVVALVRDRVLRDGGHTITREDILSRFYVTSERQLYPAPAVWDDLGPVINRKVYRVLANQVLQATNPIIIHAPGGSGKSVFCRYIIDQLPDGSMGLPYDCFAAGKYRNRSELRHAHRVALTQIVNELAAKGLCDPLIVPDTAFDQQIMQKFLSAVSAAIGNLRKVVSTANLYILIDAADNAEMAAKEFNQVCFAHELLKESLPEGCKLVMLCRTERIPLLNAPSFTTLLELPAFSQEETLEKLLMFYPDAGEADGVEFHRLTGGNPRVQANALGAGYSTVVELLGSLGPMGTTVEGQIQHQLTTAISKIKDLLPADHQGAIHKICLGLATLSPHIPIEILSKAAKVSEEAVKSFVADIGRGLWISETSVQFRDEPTETWFRKSFLAQKDDFIEYINVLEPLANQSFYVAEILPLLYLQAGKYDQLIAMAISDDFLPVDNPIEARNIKVYHLQFAFKAALKSKRISDAARIAMRAGEETAGNNRQIQLFKSNIDLLVRLQSKEKVQEIAIKRVIGGFWDGSENAYAASLLSGIDDYRGEARGYLRSALNWMNIYIDQWNEEPGADHTFEISERDFLETAYACNNLMGANACIKFLATLHSEYLSFKVCRMMAGRLIDIGDFEGLDALLRECSHLPYYIIAIVDELNKVAHFPAMDLVDSALKFILKEEGCITKNEHATHDEVTPAILSLLEAGMHYGFSESLILQMLDRFVPQQVDSMFKDSLFKERRFIFSRGLVIRSLLTGKAIDYENISAYKKEDQFKGEVKEIGEVLFPWFQLRLQVIGGKIEHFDSQFRAIYKQSDAALKKRFQYADRLPAEQAIVMSEVLAFYDKGPEVIVDEIYNHYLHKNKKFSLEDQLNFIRIVCRKTHLKCIKVAVEQNVYDMITSFEEVDIDQLTDYYVKLARAVMVHSKEDASVYFEDAIEKVSKFGDEIVDRWEAVVEMAKRASSKSVVVDELAYRFIRCAELIGKYVDREKHWNRSGAMMVCARMSPGVAISALSRWRDRSIGMWIYQLQALLTELVERKVISPSIGWALTRFLPQHHLNEFIDVLFKVEHSVVVKETILDDDIRLLRMEGTPPEYYQKLAVIATRHEISNKDLADINSFYSLPSSLPSTKTRGDHNETGKHKLKAALDDLHILGGITAIYPQLVTLNDESYHLGREDFWEVVVSYVEEREIFSFIQWLFEADDESIEVFDLVQFLRLMKKKWRGKVSFNKKWSDYIRKIGQQFAFEIISYYSLRQICEELSLDELGIAMLKEGIFEGLAIGEEFAGARTFFYFVRFVVDHISAEEAVSLVDDSLSRFELHMEDELGDGIWDNWLHVDQNIHVNIAGFIWSALGDPVTEVRWSAAHCVRKLTSINATPILDALMISMENGTVGAFGSKDFPFYLLHARLYLLIALSRASLESPDVIRNYSRVFVRYALSTTHILIQRFAADIIANIEKAFPGTYESDTMMAITGVGMWKEIQRGPYDYRVDSYWHANGQATIGISFDYAWDFDRYWYEPLGRVFGVSEEQILQLAAEIVVNEWGNTDGRIIDPREGMSYSAESRSQLTHHSHFDYPQVDDLSFYLSYHAMLVVAARLLDKMPVLSDEDEKNRWEEWIIYHSLTVNDGKWLSDFRGPLPLSRPYWILERTKDDNETNDITSDQIFNNFIINSEDAELQINVKGNWTERKDGRYEKVTITTALVSKKGAAALLHALSTYESHNDFKLPDYEDANHEINFDGFELKGWIVNDPNYKWLDKFDPYANDISYPPYTIGPAILDQLSLPSIAGDSVVSNSWSQYHDFNDKVPDQEGKRMSASLSFLKYVCQTLGCEIIFEVLVNRGTSYQYMPDRNWGTTINKLFLFSADGTFRDETKNY